MNFLDAIKTCFSKYATFQGRARRSEYWFWALFTFLIAITIGLIPIIGFIINLALVIPSIAACVRRLHDTGRSGWLYLLNLIPLVGGIILLVFCVQDSHPGANQYGPNPKGIEA